MTQHLPSVSVLVREELIDRLLIQEIACDATFAHWFLARCGVDVSRGRVTELHQSRTRRGRETDVEIHWVSGDGQRLVMLVENKIEAAFQYGQLEDYHARGEGLVRDGKVDGYRVILLAPRRYLDSSTDCAKADVRFPYEDILGYLSSRAPESLRQEYAALIFAHAVRKGERVYASVADTAVTAFWSAYLDRFSASLPGWSPKKAPGMNGARPEKSDIIYLYPTDRRLPGVRIAHKLKRRELELSFEGISHSKAEFEAYLLPLVPDGASVAWSGAKGAVRRCVPRVSPWDPFQPQVAEVDTAISVAAELVRWFEPHRAWWTEFRARLRPAPSVGWP